MLQQAVKNLTLKDAALRDPTSSVGATFLGDQQQMIANPKGLDSTARIAEGQIKSNNARAQALTDALPNSPLASILTVLNASQTNDIRGQLNDLRGLEKKRLSDEKKAEGEDARMASLIKDLKDTGRIKDAQRVADRDYEGDIRATLRDPKLNQKIIGLPLSIQQKADFLKDIIAAEEVFAGVGVNTVENTPQIQALRIVVEEMAALIRGGRDISKGVYKKSIRELDVAISKANDSKSVRQNPAETKPTSPTPLSPTGKATLDKLKAGQSPRPTPKVPDQSFMQKLVEPEGKPTFAGFLLDSGNRVLTAFEKAGQRLAKELPIGEWLYEQTKDGRGVLTDNNTGKRIVERSDGTVAIQDPSNVEQVKKVKTLKEAVDEVTKKSTSGSFSATKEELKDVRLDDAGRKRLADTPTSFNVPDGGFIPGGAGTDIGGVPDGGVSLSINPDTGLPDLDLPEQGEREPVDDGLRQIGDPATETAQMPSGADFALDALKKLSKTEFGQWVQSLPSRYKASLISELGTLKGITAEKAAPILKKIKASTGKGLTAFEKAGQRLAKELPTSFNVPDGGFTPGGAGTDVDNNVSSSRDKQLDFIRTVETGGAKDPINATSYKLDKKTGKEIRAKNGKRIPQAYGPYQIIVSTARNLPSGKTKFKGKSDNFVIKSLKSEDSRKLAGELMDELTATASRNKYVQNFSDKDKEVVIAAAYNNRGSGFFSGIIDKYKPASIDDLLSKNVLDKQTVRQITEYRRQLVGDN
tara:strand:+ start:178 stop:2439 length:2262 start_codon:yes stop_codon:yes gene_type:complete